MQIILHEGIEYAPVDEIIPGLDIIEEYLSNGAKIKWQDELWWVFDKNGDGLYCGSTIRKLLVNIILGG